MVPTHMFLTRGVGVHREKLASFEQALRSAGVAYCNLVSVSSILPPNCKIIPRKRGEKLLNPGEITHCVMARSETNERNRLISASIGLAIPTDRRTYGYLSEHHAHGETDEETGEYVETEDAPAMSSEDDEAMDTTAESPAQEEEEGKEGEGEPDAAG